MSHRNLILASCFATLTASFAIVEIAEAGPIGNGRPTPSELQPAEQVNPKSNKGAGRAGAARLIAAPGTAPAAGTVAVRPDHSLALTPKGKRPVMPHLSPGEVLRMSVGGGTEVADGIQAGVSAKGYLMTSGSLFANSINMAKHVGVGSPDSQVELAIIAENPTQSYAFEIEVSRGDYTVVVDAYWVNDTSSGFPRDHDEVLANGMLKTRDNKLFVTLTPDPSWPTPPTAYYVIVQNEVSDWTFRGAVISHAL